ncbi:hypothetical protein E8P82_08550 [Arthrobacter echini]|uniref:Uncharacterized protein n=1 Tax=Arthrobacter echini TaxID=1529066 RepID=A0A4V3Z5K8_9MICC|nr:hypothetical protein [Arthrobacter echini]THJ66499.1 hypothetical protein E8P82_08550 [Arthrobacter echini]
MDTQLPKLLHLLCTCLLTIAFLATGPAGWAFSNDSGDAGVNIGAGILLLFGYTAGALGLVLGVAALITHGFISRRERTHP